MNKALLQLMNGAGRGVLTFLMLVSPFASYSHDPSFCPAPCCTNEEPSCCGHDTSCDGNSLCDQCAAFFSRDGTAVPMASFERLWPSLAAHHPALTKVGHAIRDAYSNADILNNHHPPPDVSIRLQSIASMVLLT